MTKQQVATTNPAQINMIGEGALFEGTLRTEGDVRVSGRIHGKLIVGGRAIVAQEGFIEGELASMEADISGHVKGDLEIEQRLILRGSARVEGNIQAGRLIVEEGAVFDGECRMGASGPSLKDAKGPVKAARKASSSGQASTESSTPSRLEGDGQEKARAV